jgi:chromosome segregation ATPase
MDLLMESGQLTEEQMRQLRRSFIENKNSLRNLETITEGAQQSLDELVQSSRRAELQQRRFNRAIEEGLTAQELYADTQRQLTELSGELQDKLELGLISEQKALERQANLIEEVLNLAAGTELAGTQPIEDLRRQWDQLNAEIKETEDATEGSTDSLTQALQDFEDLKEQLAFEERFSIGTEADRARRKAEFLRETIKELHGDVDTSAEAFQNLVEKMHQFSAEADRLEEDSLKVDELRQGFEDLLETQSREFELGITDNLQAAEDQVKFLEDALQQIADSGVDMDTKGVQELQNELAAAEAIVQSYEGTAEEALSVQEILLQRFSEGSDAAKSFQQHIGNMSDEIQKLSGMDQVLAGFSEEIDLITRMMEEGDLENAEFFLEALRSQLQQMKQEADGATPVIDQMLSKLDQLEGRLQSLTPEVETFGELLENIKKRGQQLTIRSLTSGFRELGRAIGQGAGAIEAFGQAAKKTLADLAAMLGRMLIRMGVTNVAAGNIPTGLALIAAGGTLMTISGSLGGGSRRRGRGARAGRGRSAEAAEQETSFRQAEDIPGRRAGGPVRAGHPYRVGEGETEVMVPQVSGQVVPQSAFPQRGQPARQVVEVRSRMDGQVEMGSRMRDLGFQLRDLIQEAESSISEST